MYLKTLIAILVSLLAVKLEQQWSNRGGEALLSEETVNADLDLELLQDRMRRMSKPHLAAEVLQVLVTDVFIPALTRGLSLAEIRYLVKDSLPWELLPSPADAEQMELIVESAAYGVEWYRMLMKMITLARMEEQEDCYADLTVAATFALQNISLMISRGECVDLIVCYQWVPACVEVYEACSDASSPSIPSIDYLRFLFLIHLT